MIKQKKRYIPPYVEFDDEELILHPLMGSHDTDGSGEIGTEETEEIGGGSRHSKDSDFIWDTDGFDE